MTAAGFDTVPIVAVLALACFAAAIIVPLRPMWGVHAWVALLPFQFSFLRDRLNFNFAPSDVIAVGLVVALAGDLLRRTRPRSSGRAVALALSLMLPLTVSLLVGLAAGTYVAYAVVNKWFGYLFLALTAFAIARFVQDDYGAVIRLTRTLLVAVLVSATVSVAAYWLGLDTLWVWSAVQSNRLAGTLLEAPPFGALLVVAFLVQATLLLAGIRLFSVALDWLNCLLLFHAICLTFSRSAWAGLAAGGLIVAIAATRHRRTLPPIRLAVMAVLLAVTAAASFAAGYERQAVAVARSGAFVEEMFVREKTANVRYVQITEGLRLWTHAPLAGIGLGRFLRESPRWFGQPYQIHNTFVWVLVEMGVVGFLWFCLFVWTVADDYRDGARRAGDRKWWAVGFGAAFVSTLGFMVGSEGLYQRPLWWLVGIAAAVSAHRRAVTAGGFARPAPGDADDDGTIRPLAMQVVTRLNVGGITHQVIVLAQELPRAGYAAEIAAGQPAPEEGNRAGAARDAGLHVHDIADLSNRIHPLRDMRAWLELFLQFRRRRPAVVHLYMLKARILGALAARMAGVPVVVETLHGNLLQGYYNRLATAAILFCERMLGWLLVDCVVAPARSQREELLAFRIAPAERVVAQVPGMDVSGFADLSDKRSTVRDQLGIDDAVVLVGLIGRLVPIKGLDIFLSAAARVRCHSGDQVFFVIAGDGPLRQELEASAASAGVADRCVFLGQVSDVAGFYAACDIIVMSSRNEGAPIALLEAMGAGKAIVATSVGGIPDMVADDMSALLVPTENPGALAEAILRLVADPGARARLGQGARARTEEFTVRRFAAVTAAMYDELLTAMPAAADMRIRRSSAP